MNSLCESNAVSTSLRGRELKDHHWQQNKRVTLSTSLRGRELKDWDNQETREIHRRPPWEVVNWKSFTVIFVIVLVVSTSLRGRELKGKFYSASHGASHVDLLERSWIERSYNGYLIHTNRSTSLRGRELKAYIICMPHRNPVVDLLERSWIESALLCLCLFLQGVSTSLRGRELKEINLLGYKKNYLGRPPWEVVNWKIVCVTTYMQPRKRSTSLRGRELKEMRSHCTCVHIPSTSLRGRELKESLHKK